MANNNRAKLNTVALGIAVGMVFGLGIFFTGLFSVFGFGVHFATSLSSFLGANISTFRGVCVMAFWVFVFAFIHGMLIAFFYNLFCQKQNSK